MGEAEQVQQVKGQGNSGVSNTGTQAVAMGLQARAIGAQVINTEADTALKMAQAAKEAGEASKKPYRDWETIGRAHV